MSNPLLSNPQANSGITTRYIVTGTSVNGCVGRNTLNLLVLPKPNIVTSNDTSICKSSSVQLFASGGTGYTWTPINTLSNPSISNPLATPSTTTIYNVVVTGANNCSSKDSVLVSIRTASSFFVNPNAATCLGTPRQLKAGGGQTYSWTPTTGLSNPLIGTPLSNPLQTTVYSVVITDTICNESATLATTLSVLPLPFVKAQKTNDIDCSFSSSQLSANPGLQYTWTPAATISNPTIINPVASPLMTTTYNVRAKDANGCENTDSISVIVKFNAGATHYLPNAFTPNGDGLNDCFGIRNWGAIAQVQFSIYNRWGQRVFYSEDPAACWDGKVKGQLQPGGNYIYNIQANTLCGNVDIRGNVILVQ